MSENNGVPVSLPTEAKLRDIIAERKMERRLKAEEERQINLQRIRDMRSTVGIDPLKLFPKEIWAKIIQELSPEDKESVRQIHPLFRGLLEKTRIRDILFPLVLQLDKFHSYVGWKHVDSKYYEYEKLRCVSKSMRNSNDQWMEKVLVELIHGDHFDYFCIVKISNEESDVLDRLLALSQGENCTKYFRIFRRGLHVHVAMAPNGMENDLELITQFTKKITTLLEVIGVQIWYFAFHHDNLGLVEYSFPQVYISFKKWTSLMPNLRFLEINSGCYAPSHLSQQQRISIAHDIIQNQPFPHLAFLEKITLCFGHEEEKIEMLQLYSAILDANKHVEFLDIDGGDDEEIFLKFLNVDLIKSLNLANFSVRWKKLSFDGLKSIFNSNWKLKTITLNLEESFGTSLISLFQFLEKFPTLANVTLRLPTGIKFKESDKLGYLALPNLTKFEMTISKPKIKYKSNIHFFFSLQFLLQCKKLKTIKWTMHDFNDVKLREHLVERECRWKTIDFRAGLRYLYESNIWDVFPSLTTVQVGFRKENADRENVCEEEYQRGVRGEGLSVGEFLKEHVCCRCNRLQNCAILFG